MRGALCLILSAGPGHAALPVVPPPDVVVTHRSGPLPGTYPLPGGPVTPTSRPLTMIAGQIETEVWRFPGQGPGSAALLAGLTASLTGTGWQVGFDCADRACGGFDFRFALPVVDAPEMEVDLGAFQFRSLSRGGEHLTLLASVAGTDGFVQIARITPDAGPGVIVAAPLPPVDPQAPPPEDPATTAFAPASAPVAPAARPLADMLAAEGRAVLDGVSFTSGAAVLAPGAETALAELAALLTARADLSVIIVGHTDAQGAVEGNLALSRTRAAVVVEALTRRFGIPARQVSAAGAGPLAPLASNATDAGRAANRRVEVVLR